MAVGTMIFLIFMMGMKHCNVHQVSAWFVCAIFGVRFFASGSLHVMGV